MRKRTITLQARWTSFDGAQSELCQIRLSGFGTNSEWVELEPAANATLIVPGVGAIILANVDDAGLVRVCFGSEILGKLDVDAIAGANRNVRRVSMQLEF